MKYLKLFEDNDYFVTLKKTDIQVFKNKETIAFITISLKQKIDSLSAPAAPKKEN